MPGLNALVYTIMTVKLFFIDLLTCFFISRMILRKLNSLEVKWSAVGYTKYILLCLHLKENRKLAGLSKSEIKQVRFKVVWSYFLLSVEPECCHICFVVAFYLKHFFSWNSSPFENAALLVLRRHSKRVSELWTKMLSGIQIVLSQCSYFSWCWLP